VHKAISGVAKHMGAGVGTVRARFGGRTVSRTDNARAHRDLRRAMIRRP
jgi:hypothetical protein